MHVIKAHFSIFIVCTINCHLLFYMLAPQWTKYDKPALYSIVHNVFIIMSKIIKQLKARYKKKNKKIWSLWLSRHSKHAFPQNWLASRSNNPLQHTALTTPRLHPTRYGNSDYSSYKHRALCGFLGHKINALLC